MEKGTKNRYWVGLTCFFLLIFIPVVTYAQVPQKMNYQGYLTDPVGMPINGTVLIVFSIYDVPMGGTALWSEALNVSVNQGLVQVVLGDISPVNLIFDTSYYLGIKVGSDPEMMPRGRLVTVPYAFRAKYADSVMLEDTSVTSAKIADGAVTTGKLADNSVTSAKLQDGAVSAGKLAASSVTEPKLSHNTTLIDAGGGVIGVDVGTTANKIVRLDGAGKLPGVDGSQLLNVSMTLSDNSVTTPKIQDGAVTDAKVTGLISGSKIGTHSHVGEDIASGTLPDSVLSPNTALLNNAQTFTGLKSFNPSSGTVPFSVDATKWGVVTNLNADMLDGYHASAFVTAGQVNSVTSSMIVDGQVGASDINSSQVQQRVNGSCTAGSSIRVINADGTVICEADDVGSFTGWGLTGNTGTNPSTNFLGTTDNQPLYLRVNNMVALRITPNSYSPNIVGGHPYNVVSPGVVGATISGGGSASAATFFNSITDDYGTIGGGESNIVGNGDGDNQNAGHATVGGGYHNTASGSRATVGGGYDNNASAVDATVGGGRSNTASGGYATVSGGYANNASSDSATIGGGQANTASGYQATIAGGSTNEANASLSTIGGGLSNLASGGYAVVGGGNNNTVSGYAATVPGGENNTTSGNYSFAAGRRAIANNTGCFVWGDSTDADVTCNDDNRWVARASGGVYFYTSSTLTSGVYVPAGGNAWSPGSDRNLKENFSPVDGKVILARLAEIPISSWNYKSQDSSIRHMGPVAQDFAAVFGLGESDKHISTIDADGVALAAIKGLYQVVQEKEARIAELESLLSTMGQRLSALEGRLVGGAR